MKRRIILLLCCLFLLTGYVIKRGSGGSSGGAALNEDSVGTEELDDGSDTPLAGEYVQVDPGDVTRFSYTLLTLPVDATLDADGQMTLDLTDDQLQFRGDTAISVLIAEHTKCFTIEDPNNADDNIPLWIQHPTITVQGMRCIVEGGTSVTGFLSDGTDALDTMICTTSGTTLVGGIANRFFAADERLEWDQLSNVGTPTWLNFCWTYTVDPT